IDTDTEDEEEIDPEDFDIDENGRLVYATRADRGGVKKPVRKDQQKQNLGKLAERVASFMSILYSERNLS
ncbi:hypothetical protein RUND412_008696, partial [Rhizina undulata]